MSNTSIAEGEVMLVVNWEEWFNDSVYYARALFMAKEIDADYIIAPNPAGGMSTIMRLRRR